jgi:hypothetical protein
MNFRGRHFQGRWGGSHLHPDVHGGGNVGGAFGLYHHGADIVDQDGRSRDSLSRLEGPNLISRGILATPHLHQTEGLYSIHTVTILFKRAATIAIRMPKART